MVRRLAIVCGILCYLCLSVNGQQIRFRRHTVENGLSSNNSNFVTQDPRGYIWIGCFNGLNRFDGVNYKHYQHKDGDPHSIQNRFAMSMLVDRRGTYWVGSETGVDIFDPQTDYFTPFNKLSTDSMMIGGGVKKIVEDKNGDIWFGTWYRGLFHYDVKNDILTRYIHQRNAPSIPPATIWDLFADSKGEIWIGSSSGGLCHFDPVTKIFTLFYADGKPGSINDESIHKIYEDSYGNIWIGGFNKGLNRYNRETKKFEQFLDGIKGPLLYHIHDIREYTPGQLFISSDEGLMLFNIATQEHTLFLNSPTDDTSLSDNFVYGIYKDNEGGFWFDTYLGGVNYFSPYSQNFSYYSAFLQNEGGRVMSAMCEDEKGNLWVGTDDQGLSYFNTKTGIFSKHPLGDINSQYNIHALLIDGDYLWVGTYSRGLLQMNRKTGKVVRKFEYDDDNPERGSLLNPSVYSLYKANDGRLFIGTTGGLSYYDEENKVVIPVTMPRTGINIYAIVQDDKGTMWIGSQGQGLYAWDMKTLTWKSYTSEPGNVNSVPDDYINSICIDRHNRIWVGTNDGLCLFNEKSNNFTRYSHNVTSDQAINSIISDGDQLWLATNRGLINYNPSHNVFQLYSKASGLISEQFCVNSYLRMENGHVYLGTANGLIAFNPRTLIENVIPPRTEITGFSIFNRSSNFGDNDSPLSQTIETTKAISLSQKNANIGFELSALSFVSPEENKYAYKLDGFDKDWTYTDADHRRVSYTNLPSGDYTFRVRGANNNNIWGLQEQSLHIEVIPAWYLSLWAKIVYILASFTIIFFVIRHYVNSSERKHQKKIQLLSVEKEKELYDAKLALFTNIAHEIRTPLSLITAPLEELIKQHKGSEEDEQLENIDRNYHRLLSLVNQLLDFRKVESGRYELRMSRLSPKKTIDQIVERFNYSARQKGIQFVVNLPEETLQMASDEEAIVKIFSNILNNAFKHTETVISIQYALTDNDGITFTVTDDGPGIPEGDKAGIFQLFYQVPSQGEKNRKMGAGIGLHLCQSLVELLGGSITVGDNPNGHGASFSVTLPLHTEMISTLPSEERVRDTIRVENIDFEESSQSPINTQEKGNKEFSVLVIDDNVEIRDMLYKVLGQEFYVISAGSGREALTFLDNNTIDLIICDIMMPEMDGFEFCKIVKNNLKISHIPIVLITARTDTSSKIEGLDRGADAYLEKPFSPSLLISQIHNLLRQRHELKEKFANSPLAGIKTMTHSTADEQFITSIADAIHKHLTDSDFGVEQLAEEMCMSRTSLFVKLKALCDMTPNDFIKTIRLKEACRLMASGEHRVNEVTYQIGFNSASYFAKCFSKQFGMLPAEFIKRCKAGTIDDDFDFNFPFA